jgi:phage gp36-like protein
MAWTILTEADVRTRLTGPELNALKTAALASGQSDPLPEIVSQVVDEVRGYVAVRFALSAGSTVPSKLVSASLAIIRYRLATRLPVKGLLTDERKEENQDAIRLLRRVADGPFAIEEAATKSEEHIGVQSPSITARDNNHRRKDQDGL